MLAHVRMAVVSLITVELCIHVITKGLLYLAGSGIRLLIEERIWGSSI